MDWQKLATAITSTVSGLMSVLVVTGAVSGDQSQIWTIAISSLLTAVSSILASNTGKSN